MNRVFRCVLLLMLLIGLAHVSPATAQTPGPDDQLRTLAKLAEQGAAAAEQNQPTLMRAEYDEIHELWESFEDQVRAQDATGYVELETALDAVKDAVNAATIDTGAVKSAYEKLEHEAEEVAGRLGGMAGSVAAPLETSLPDALQRLDAASAAVDRGDASTAAAEVDTFIRAWPAIEGAVATKSADAYEAIEGDLGRARAALAAQPADLPAAKTAIERMRGELAPLAGDQAYTAFDAALIILREGLEALLVIVALLAFLRICGNAD
jgi:high-affinity iron transporter